MDERVESCGKFLLITDLAGISYKLMAIPVYRVKRIKSTIKFKKST